MTFKIIKPLVLKNQLPIDENLVKSQIIEGMKNDTILNLHDAASVTRLNGDMIQDIFESLKIELKKLSDDIDKEIALGKNLNEAVDIVKNESLNFDIRDIKQLKIEVLNIIK